MATIVFCFPGFCPLSLHMSSLVLCQRCHLLLWPWSIHLFSSLMLLVVTTTTVDAWTISIVNCCIHRNSVLLHLDFFNHYKCWGISHGITTMYSFDHCFCLLNLVAVDMKIFHQTVTSSCNMSLPPFLLAVVIAMIPFAFTTIHSQCLPQIHVPP